MSSNGKFQEISSLIWNVCDDVLRGLFKSHEYGDVILPFITLRRLDCMLEPQKSNVVELYHSLKKEVDPSPIIFKKTGLKFYNYSQYDLSRLKGDPNGIKLNFQNYLNGFSDNVHEILQNFQIDKLRDKLSNNQIVMNQINSSL
jgi:type I restriction enzyme M protein